MGWDSASSSASPLRCRELGSREVCPPASRGAWASSDSEDVAPPQPAGASGPCSPGLLRQDPAPNAGWTSSDSDAGQDCQQNLPEVDGAGGPASSSQPPVLAARRGRPKGLAGGADLRRRMQEDQEARRAERAAALPQPGSIEFARLVRARKKQEADIQRQSAKQVQPIASGQYADLFQLQLRGLGDDAQQCLLKTFTAAARVVDVEAEPDELLGYFLNCKSLTASAQAIASFFNSTKTQVTRMLVSTSLAIFFLEHGCGA